MKENKKKTSREKKVLIGALSLAAVTMASSTFAWFTSKDEVTNRLSANADYNVRIVESFAAPNNWLPGNVTNKDVYATNTGNIPAFVKEEVSGVLTITTEKVTSAWSENSVKLTPEEVYVMEAGAFLAYKPVADDKNDLGDQIVMVTSEVDPANSERFETKTDFTPTAEGLYVFRRTIVVESDRKEAFTYEGYYYKNGEYYKISNLKTTPDGNEDLANDGVRTDGQITSATHGYYEYENRVVSPVDLRYEPKVDDTTDADGNVIKGHSQRLVATYATGTKDYKSDAVKDAASERDRANHEYELAKELFDKATQENNTSSSSVTTAKSDLDSKKLALDTAQAEYDAALLARDKAKVESDNADKTLAYLETQKNASDTKISSLTQKKNDAQTALSSATVDSRSAFENEYPTALSMTYDELLGAAVSAEAHDYYSKLIAFKIAERDLAEEQTKNENLQEQIGAEDKIGSATEIKKSANDALASANTNLGGKKTDRDLAESDYNDALTAYKNALSADDNKNATLIDATNRYQAAIKAKADADAVYQALVDGDNNNAISDGDANLLTIYINLSDDVMLTGGVANKWQMFPTTIENNTAVFYYTSILGTGDNATSSKLIDSVELDKDTTKDMYKSFDFDLNVKLDSAQITYADDNETILATAANEQFDVKDETGKTIKDITATLTDSKSLGTAINWSDYITPDLDSDPNTDTP